MYFLIHPESFMQMHGLDKKLLTIFVFCLFKRNRQLLPDPTGDSATERLQKSFNIWLKNLEKIFIRKFGIVGKVTDCDAQGRGFESSQS